MNDPFWHAKFEEYEQSTQRLGKNHKEKAASCI
jgi:hypothetical protein